MARKHGDEEDDEMMPVAGQQRRSQDAPRKRAGYQRQSIGEAVAKSFIRSIASSLGRIIVRAITGRMR